MAKKTEEGGELISFNFGELSLRTGKGWRLKLYVRQVLAESLARYRVHLAFNEQPHLDRISQIENDIKFVDPDLFSSKKERQKELRSELADEQARLEEARKECQPYDFDASVEEVKYKRESNETFVVFSIVHDDALKLADMEPNLDRYKVSLEAQG